MYAPEKTFSSPEAQSILTNNQGKVVSTLDVFPTLQHILYGCCFRYGSQAHWKYGGCRHKQKPWCCISGVDLMSARTYSMIESLSPGTLHQIRKDRFLLFRITKGWRSLLRYDECTKNGTSSCVGKLMEENRMFWRNFLDKKNATVSHQFMNSDPIMRLRRDLGLWMRINSPIADMEIGVSTSLSGDYICHPRKIIPAHDEDRGRDQGQELERWSKTPGRRARILRNIRPL